MAFGCDRIFVAPFPSTKCKRCGSVHVNYEVNSIREALDLEALMSEETNRQQGD